MRRDTGSRSATRARILKTIERLGYQPNRMARATEVEARLDHLSDALTHRLGESAPLVNSFTRMLATIERQTDEINQFTERLGGAYQEIEAAKARLEEVEDPARERVGDRRGVTPVRHRPELDGPAGRTSRPALHRGLGGRAGVAERVERLVEPVVVVEADEVEDLVL